MPAVLTLLVYKNEKPMGQLRGILERLGSSVVRARTRQEAAQILAEAGLPALVFTDLFLPDGNWQDVVNLSKSAPEPADVVVISEAADNRIFIDALERGAFDFAVPPFDPLDLAYIVRTARWDLLNRKQTFSHAA